MGRPGGIIRNPESKIMEQLFVIKIGGNVIDDDNNLSAFLKTFAAIGGKKILIHGGGKIAINLGGDGQWTGMDSLYFKNNIVYISVSTLISIVTMYNNICFS